MMMDLMKSLFISSDYMKSLEKQALNFILLLGTDYHMKFVHEKPHHPQSQGSVERANGNIKGMLVTWIADNESQDWTTGIKFVHFRNNCAHHSGIICSPYSAMFGSEAWIILTSSLPHEVMSIINNS